MALSWCGGGATVDRSAERAGAVAPSLARDGAGSCAAGCTLISHELRSPEAMRRSVPRGESCTARTRQIVGGGPSVV